MVELVAGFESLPAAMAEVEAQGDLFKNSLQECHVEALPGAAIVAAAADGHRQTGVARPGLDESESLGAGGVGFENLGEPGPEDRNVAEVTLPGCRIIGLKKIGGKEA